MTTVNVPKLAGDYIVTPPTSTPSGTTQTIDWNDGTFQVLDLGSASGNVTLTLSNPEAGCSYLLEVIQGATARTLTWPAAVYWEGGSAPTISTTEDAIDLISLAYNGSVYLCSFVQDLS